MADTEKRIVTTEDEPKSNDAAKTTEEDTAESNDKTDAAPKKTAKKKKEPIERKFVKASTGETEDKPQGTTAVADIQKQVEPVGQKVTGLRIASWVLWAVGIAAEVMAILFFNGTIYWGNKMAFTIGALAIDLVVVVIASQLWKKANHLNPPSGANKVKFNLQEQLGAIMSVIAFLPFIVLALTNKNADKQSKTIAGVVAAIMLVVCCGTSIDFNPVSAEEQQAANEAAATYGGGTVYWTAYGHVYHLNPDCPHILNSGTIFSGNVSEALDAKRDRLCATCAAEQNVSIADAPALAIDDSGETGTFTATAGGASSSSSAASSSSSSSSSTASSSSSNSSASSGSSSLKAAA